ncbi:MAG: tetratricopeptide repeat protein [Elusimicrobia bacterium]|nr:tetratricopeptide repeat protein [Elusimicrobiota bacterium]
MMKKAWILLLWAAPLAGSADPWAALNDFGRARWEARLGRWNESIARYRGLAAQFPESVAVRRALAETALRAGRPEDAMSAAREWVALDSATAAGFLALGRAQLAAGETAAARTAFDQALRLEPENVEALGWASSHRERSDPGAARALLEKFLLANPEQEDVRTRLAEMQQTQGDYAAAEKTWKKVLAQDPENLDAQLALAGLYDARGDTATAVAAYAAYLELNPDDVQVLTRLGQLEYGRDRGDAARDLLDRALRLAPDNESALFWRALIDQDKGDWPSALARMERVAESNRDPGVLIRLATYYSRLGRTRDALRVFKTLQKSQPDNPDFAYYLALAHAEAGRVRSARRWLTRTVALDPARVDAHFQLALAWDKAGKFDRAVPALRRVIALNPEHHVALNYLGYSWADRGENLEEALSLVRRAVALDPENPAYRDSLGWVFFRLGRWDEAIAALESAAPIAADAVVWRHYGDALAQQGRTDAARRAWREAHLADPADSGTRQRLGSGLVPDDVTDLSGPRVLLKRAERNFRGMNVLSGVAAVAGRAGDGFPVRGSALFYYARPDRFRFELLGPPLTPQMVLISVGGRSRWSPTGAIDVDPGPWLALLGGVFSGAVFSRFDDPAVTVRVEGGHLLYSGPAGELRLDLKTKTPLSLSVPDPSGAPVRLAFADPREVDGVWLPGAMEVRAPNGVALTFRFSRMAVGEKIHADVFRLDP